MEREKILAADLDSLPYKCRLRNSELEMYGVFHMLQAIMEVEYLFYYICVPSYVWNSCTINELAMGRASKSSIIRTYHELERPGQKWHIHGYLGMIGNYILLFFYTTVSGWMLGYFIKYVTGDITKNTDSSQMFADVIANPMDNVCMDGSDSSYCGYCLQYGDSRMVLRRLQNI